MHDRKLRQYQRIRVPFYVVFDPDEVLKGGLLRVFDLNSKPRQIEPGSIRELGIGLTLWDGEYEGMKSTWLRWLDATGNLILTTKERAETEKAQANDEKGWADNAAALTYVLS